MKIDKVYQGTTEFVKGYKGNILLWEPGIPKEYQRLEFIESSGTQWIDTGVNGGTTPEYEIKFNNLGKPPQNYYMYFGGTGSYHGTQTPKIYMYAYSSDSQGRYGYVIDDANIKLFYTVFDTNTVKLKNGNYYVNGSLKGSHNFNQGWSYPGYDVWIFNNSRETSLAAPMRLFYCKMWTDGVLVRDYVPVKIKATGEAGLYDLVTKQFYSNAGTGSFIAGPEMLPDTYTLLDYIESTGYQYIDTGVSGGSSCKYMISGMIKNTGVVNTYQHFFAGLDQSKFPKIFQDNGSISTPTSVIKAQSKASGSDVNVSFSNLYNVKFNIDYAMTQSNRVTLNTTVQNTNITDRGWGTNTVYVFGRHETASKLCVGRVYHLEMYTGNSLVRYYVPVKRNIDNELGLFDLVTQTFYTNQGTGKFVEGPIVYDDKFALLEYIESTGTQYINTGYYPNANTNIDVKFAATTNTTSWSCLLGERYQQSGWPNTKDAYGVWFKYTSPNQWVAYNRGGNDSGASTPFNTGDSVIVTSKGGNFYVNGSLSYTVPDNTMNTASYPIYLYCVDIGGTLFNNKCSAKIYYCKFIENGAEIMNLVPVRRISDNAVGMYDTISQILYTNIGTGSFVEGPSLNHLTYTYTGASSERDVNVGGTDYKIIELSSSGTITFNKAVTADIWICGGGSNGLKAGDFQPSGTVYNGAGPGGAGAYCAELDNQSITSLNVTIGQPNVASGTIITGDVSLTAAGVHNSQNGGTGGGAACVYDGGIQIGQVYVAGGTGDGNSKYPFGDELNFTPICAGGGGGQFFAWIDYKWTSRNGGNGGSNGGDGKSINGQMNSGNYGGGRGGAIDSVGNDAAYYGGGGGGGGGRSYSSGTDNFRKPGFEGGSGKQGVCYLRIPASLF